MKSGPRTCTAPIIAVPVVNMHMFSARTPFISPLDGINLNKIAPGGDGSISEILARTLFDEVIRKAEYHIDFHAGDFGEMLLEFAGVQPDWERKTRSQGRGAGSGLYSAGFLSRDVGQPCRPLPVSWPMRPRTKASSLFLPKLGVMGDGGNGYRYTSMVHATSCAISA